MAPVGSESEDSDDAGPVADEQSWSPVDEYSSGVSSEEEEIVRIGVTNKKRKVQPSSEVSSDDEEIVRIGLTNNKRKVQPSSISKGSRLIMSVSVSQIIM